MPDKKNKTESKQEEVMYIKLDYSEAHENKKRLLSSEISFLRISKSIKNYKMLRQEELNLKLKMGKKINDVDADIKRLKIILPKIRIHELPQKPGEKSDIEKKIEFSKKQSNTSDIEFQLQEIQEKLRRMSG